MSAEQTIARDAGSERARRYQLYGLDIVSDITLPVLAGTGTRDVAAAWRFHRSSAPTGSPRRDLRVVAELRCHPQCRILARARRDDIETWIWNRSVGTFRLRPGERRVDVYPHPAVETTTLGFVLVGQVSVSILHQLGIPSLHASAVCTPRGALGFLGPKGRGKSTMAAIFLRDGATLVADDVLPLRVMPNAVLCGPGPGLMKLWPSTLKWTLGIDSALPAVLERYPKRLLTLEGRYPVAQDPLPLRALYVLNRYESETVSRSDVTITGLGARDALVTLVRHTSWSAYLLPHEKASLMQKYAEVVRAVPVRQVNYPNSFAYQDDVRRRILADGVE